MYMGLFLKVVISLHFLSSTDKCSFRSLKTELFKTRSGMKIFRDAVSSVDMC